MIQQSRTPRISVGAVNYLNARPLMFTLPQLLPEADIVVDFPSHLADGLADGRFDVALIPSIEYLRQPELRIASDAAIACDGPVRSVKLYGRVPIERVETLALDEGSRTSAALAQILLRERFALKPRLLPLPLECLPADSPADAVVVIGDRGMLGLQEDLAFAWDLGEEWSRWTGLPFVFALWAARPHVQEECIDRALAAARNEGLTRLPEIARLASPEVGLPESECLSYLRDNLKFHLGPRQQEGLERFYQLAKRHGLA
ncbi:MAG: menaquinone biosynthetic enzyme MqnA/MqnD family protein [Thermoguttaceae bacterium]